MQNLLPYPIGINTNTTRIFVIKFNIYNEKKKNEYFCILLLPAGESEHSEIADVNKREERRKKNDFSVL